MGMRSQIYVRVGNELVARYYQWNYGERMVSRARYLVEWLDTGKEYIEYNKDKIYRIADTNFDMIDVVVSTDIIEEYKDWPSEEYEFNEYVFGCPGGNNDGKLYVYVTEDEVKYAFTDDEDSPKSAGEYLKWDSWNKTVKEAIESLNKDAQKYTKDNMDFLKKYKRLTKEEIKELFLENTFDNDPTKPF